MLSLSVSRCAVAGSRAIHRPSNALARTKETGDESPYYYRANCGASRLFFAADCAEKRWHFGVGSLTDVGRFLADMKGDGGYNGRV